MNKSQNIAIGGTIAGLGVLCLYMGSIIINNRLFFLILATYVSSVPYIKGGIKTGLLTYASISILSLFLLPNKLYAIYFVFLGVYPFVKLICERNKTKIEFLGKYVWFNLTIILIYALFGGLIHINTFFKASYGAALLIISLEILFFVYDFLFTKFIMFIQDKMPGIR